MELQMELHRMKDMANMRLTSTDKKHICQTLINVKEMLTRQNVIET